MGWQGGRDSELARWEEEIFEVLGISMSEPNPAVDGIGLYFSSPPWSFQQKRDG